ncbi:hypothetical protein [Paenibacillus lautus]
MFLLLDLEHRIAPMLRKEVVSEEFINGEAMPLSVASIAWTR